MQYPCMHEGLGPAGLVLFPRLVGLETSVTVFGRIKAGLARIDLVSLARGRRPR